MRGRYYVLVAVCVLGRGSEWLRGACLAAALLVPAVAALHGIVLAAIHVDGKHRGTVWNILGCADSLTLGAVDMDVYGAFRKIPHSCISACARLTCSFVHYRNLCYRGLGWTRDSKDLADLFQHSRPQSHFPLDGNGVVWTSESYRRVLQSHSSAVFCE